MVESYSSKEIGNLTIVGEYANTLDMEGFSLMMKDPSYCYKFYWLEAIVQLVSRGITETTFDEIINEMICNAWYSVRELHVHLSGLPADGVIKDALERAVLRLTELSSVPANASKEEIRNAILEFNRDVQLKSVKEQLTNMVPYRALAGFFAKSGTVAVWESTKRMVAYIEKVNREVVTLPYVVL